jgi:hypothetical protein
MLYRINFYLYSALHDLERLASSWSGSPEHNPAIRRAREALAAYRADSGLRPWAREAARFIVFRFDP